VLEIEPSSAAAFAGLGKIAALRGDPARAAESFRKALELQPQASSLHHPLGMALRDLGDLEGARAHLGQNRQGNVLIPDPLMRELTQLVRSAQFHLKAGNRAAARGDLELARGEYERAAELAPADATPLYNLGKILAETGDPAGAIVRFEAAIAREPDHRNAHFNLATTLARLGRFGEAAEHFSAACRIDPHDLEAHLGRGMALLLGERYAAARTALETSLTAQPESRPLTHLLARLLAAAPDAAVRDGARALELARAVFGAEQTLEHAETLAMALAENGRFEEAAEWQARVVGEAERRGMPAPALARLRARLEGYRAGRPCRAPWLGG
jgi:Flp pilus assembly protein TadD